MTTDTSKEPPEWLWCWNFQTEAGSWDKGWGGYARADNRHPLDERERNTGAEYVRADLLTEARAEIERLNRNLLAIANAPKHHRGDWYELVEWMCRQARAALQEGKG